MWSLAESVLLKIQTRVKVVTLNHRQFKATHKSTEKLFF